MLTVLTIDLEQGPARGRLRRRDDRRATPSTRRDERSTSRRSAGGGMASRRPSDAADPPFDLAGAADAPSTAPAAQVPGYLLNQFSLSEHEGVLRVADRRRRGGAARESESHVTVLETRAAGSCSSATSAASARGERIYAVRFIDDRGYVVTFRQVDPLYTLDLSDPRAPEGARRAEDPRLLRLPAPGRRATCCSASARTRPRRAAARARSSRCSTSPTRRRRSCCTRRALGEFVLERGRVRPPRVPVVGAVAARGRAGLRLLSGERARRRSASASTAPRGISEVGRSARGRPRAAHARARRPAVHADGGGAARARPLHARGRAVHALLARKFGARAALQPS